MADVIKYAFSFDCTDSAGDIFRLDVVARSDGQLEVDSDYDLGVDLTWAELSGGGRESNCADELERSDSDPLTFLLRLAPVSDFVKIRIAAAFAKQAWMYADVEMPQSVANVIAFAVKHDPVRVALGQMVLRRDVMVTQGWDELRAADANRGAWAALWAAHALDDAWQKAALGTEPQEALVAVARQGQLAAAGNYPGESKLTSPQACAERAWQLHYMLRCLNAEQRGEPWPSR